MTQFGGSNNIGTIFKIDFNTTNFQVLYSFVSPSSDGSTPYGSLVLSGSTLYGMAGSVQTPYQGTIIRIGTDGSEFRVLTNFSGANGKWPYSDLTPSGSVLYGITTYGGNNTNSGYVGGGTVFCINNDGSDLQVRHTFVGGASDGANPYSPVIQSGSTLYGTCNGGGGGGAGVVFKMTNGWGFKLLHSFYGGSNDGSYPCFGKLILSGANLYGMTSGGGSSDKGTIFRVDTNNGAGFKVLHSFEAGASDGAVPTGALIQSGTNFYGMTSGGGVGGNGVIFQTNTNGTPVKVLHSFKSSNGQSPTGDLVLSGSTLYGMTQDGGNYGQGVIFALDLFPKLAVVLNGTNLNLSWSTNYPDFTLESTGNLTGGWTSVPGVTGYSATLPVSPGSNQFFRLRR
jgi:uncharacterized repeat protein (TIGR03803 family)